MKRKKRRKPQQARNRTVARKRQKQFQQACSLNRRARFIRRRQLINTAKSRNTSVAFYRAQKSEGTRERDAAKQTAQKWQVSGSTIRRWDQLHRKEGWRGLLDRSKRPLTIHYQIHTELKLLVVVIRTLLGWGERRISAELERRGIGTISHTSCNKLFREYHLPIKTYHPKGKSDGLKRCRYRRRSANELWHLDFKGPLTLLNGQKVSLLIIIDDFSRFCLSRCIVTSATAEATIAALRTAFARYGKPKEILTDNGTAFTSVWQNSVGQLDAFLAPEGVLHRLISAYYPESNGKAEAFIKILSTECLTLRAFADMEELQQFVEQFLTYYNPYRGHGSLSYQPPITWYAGVSPKVTGFGGIPGLERVAQQWSGESSAEAPIHVTEELLIQRKALVPLAA